MNGDRRLCLWSVLVGVIVWAVVMQVQISSFEFACNSVPGGCKQIAKVPLAAELARSSSAFQCVIDQGNRSHNIHVMKVNTWMDFLFIALYWSVLYLFARYYNNRPWSNAVIVPISLGAICDVL